MTETFQLTETMAAAYEEWFVPRFFAQWVPHLLDATGVEAGQRVVDVACGTGVVARGAAARGAGVTGVDVNPAMLTVARRVEPQIDWRQGDVAALPCEDGEYDVALCQMAMMFFPDPVAAMRELRRVVRPGGAVAVLVPGPLEANPPYQVFVDVVSRNAGPDARRLVTTYFALGDLDRLTGYAREAGLEPTATTRPSGWTRYGSVDEMVAVELDSTPLGGRLDPPTRDRITAECRTGLTPYVTDGGGLEFAFECVLVAARRIGGDDS
ncbi:MAG: class I SAM-dependent methyltransferase [Kribbellaceae bacterium]